MSLEGFRQLIQHLSQEYWPLVTMGVVGSWAFALVALSIAVLVRLQGAIKECRALRQEVKMLVAQISHERREHAALRKELKAVLDQASHWAGRADALYPSLADLLDDKLAMLAQLNGYHK